MKTPDPKFFAGILMVSATLATGCTARTPEAELVSAIDAMYDAMPADKQARSKEHDACDGVAAVVPMRGFLKTGIATKSGTVDPGMGPLIAAIDKYQAATKEDNTTLIHSVLAACTVSKLGNKVT